MTRIKNFINEIFAWYLPKKEDKVFCIGLHKTGTTSLAKALTILGYNVKDYPTIRLLGNKFLWFKGTQLNDYNCFTDSTVIPLYKRLDRKFPNSKFILTTRPLDSWLESCSKWPNFNRPGVTGKRKIYRERVLGAKNFNETLYKKKYKEHLDDVHEYFKDRPQDLLVLEISQENKWTLLADFLDKPIPSVPYPHSNSGKNKLLINKIILEEGLGKDVRILANKVLKEKNNLKEEDILEFLKEYK